MSYPNTSLLSPTGPSVSVPEAGWGLTRDGWRGLGATIHAVVRSAVENLTKPRDGIVAGAARISLSDNEGPETPESAPSAAISIEMSMEDLIREHSDAVYRVALSVTRDPVLAEDVSQDALIKAWQALPTFRGDAPLRNWVLRITHNTAISTLRKRRDELREPDQLPERENRHSVESQVQNRLALARFEEALADLDELSRSIIVLREVEGLSYSELCDMLDLPMPTVKTRLLRARRQLATALEGWQP